MLHYQRLCTIVAVAIVCGIVFGGRPASSQTQIQAGQVIISEFLTSAESTAGLRDEDGELQDWIELYNSGSTAVDLAGWSLTDDPDEPSLWTFPSVSIPAGGRLVVFASSKDRKSTAAGARTRRPRASRAPQWLRSSPTCPHPRT